MGKTPEEMAQELESAKKQAEIDSNRRKILYAQSELDMIKDDRRKESLKLLINIVQKYSISNEDVIVLLDCVPYV